MSDVFGRLHGVLALQFTKPLMQSHNLPYTLVGVRAFAVQYRRKKMTIKFAAPLLVGMVCTIVLIGLGVIALLLLARLVIHSRNLPHK